MHERTLFHLRALGVASHELRALNAKPMHPLPLDRDGFGIIGGTGVGKTWALVQALGADLDEIVTSSLDPATAMRPAGYAAWVNWPDQAEGVKGMLSQDYNADVEDLASRWEHVGRLFIDDLGAERIVGERDFSLALLRRVLDARYRHERATYWTSNLGLKALSGLYGSRLMSRVCEAWPAVVLRGSDLRLRGQEAAS